MKKFALIVFIFAALLASACSTDAAVDQATVPAADEAGSNSAAEQPREDDTQEPEPAAAEPAAAEPTEVPPAPAAEEDDAPDPAPAPTVDTTSATAQLGSDDWCTAARQIEGTVLGGDDGSFLSDPASLEQAYSSAAALINEAVGIAPPAIAADVAASAVAFGELNLLLEEAEWDFLAIDLQAMEAAVEGMEISGYNIEKYNYDVCGIGEDPGDAPDITSDEFDEPLPSGSARDLIVESFMTGGFTEAEALCVVDQIDITNPEEMGNPQAMLAAFNECGISLDRLSELGG